MRFKINSEYVLDREAYLLLDLLSSYGFKQKNFHPTRKNNCLDNVFSNFDVWCEYAEVVETTFSDHDAQLFHVTFDDVKKKNLTEKNLHWFQYKARTVEQSIVEFHKL